MKWYESLGMIFTLHCEHASRLLSDQRERRLTWTERVALAGHLLVCAPCRRFKRQLRTLHELMHRFRDECARTRPAMLSETKKQHIRQLIADSRRS
jgi:hypothetical protein